MASAVFWHPEHLNARLVAAAAPARARWAVAAKARCSSAQVAGSIGVVGDKVVAAHPLSLIIEEGARPHTIEPRQAKALRLADGSFVSGTISHPGSPAKPFMKPTLRLWPEMYRGTARSAFRGV